MEERSALWWGATLPKLPGPKLVEVGGGAWWLLCTPDLAGTPPGGPRVY